MNRNHHALILETAKDGSVEVIADLSAFGSAAAFKKIVKGTCAALRRRGIEVASVWSKSADIRGHANCQTA